jgi:DNA (cytosine-5)-methyltransferase 1
MTAIYNEIEPFAAAWMRELMANGHIAQGVVDERSISDLTPADVAGPGQRHFFAGVGGWSYALRLAGVPDDADVWTGSCPCQPFSTAGRRRGANDERHLWPEWFRLIRECRPPVVFGEQVASPAGLEWFDSVSSDMEGANYACAASDLCAAGVGAPHIRQRLYFVAVANMQPINVHAKERQPGGSVSHAHRNSPPILLGDAGGTRGGRHPGTVSRSQRESSSERIRVGRLVDIPVTTGATGGFWRDAEWVACRDGKARPVEPGAFPLADGAASRVGRLRATGNAIVPQVAATFIQAALGALDEGV